MADLPLLGDELRRRLALERDRQLGIDPGAGNDRGYAFNQWLPVSTNKVGSASWVQQGADPKLAVPEVMQGGLLGGADLLDSPRTGKLTPEALGSLLTGSTLSGGLLAPKGSLASGGSIKAYHGSPHDFDRFDASKIGTGEGAQAYGHGLYFAENEGVARGYRDAVTASHNPDAGKARFLLGDQEINALDVPRGIFNFFDAKSTPSKSNADLLGLAQANVARVEAMRSPQIRALELPKANEALDFIKSNPSFVMSNELPRGHMYEVNIKADPQKFLDWDKPLSGQPAPVLDRLSRLDINARTQPTDPSGARLYQSGASVGGHAATAQSLTDIGIPGIKYLDQGSRTGGAGTSNYVVFPTQEEIIQILRKYGLAAPSPVVPGAQGAPTPGLLSDQQSEIPTKDRVY